MMRLKLLKATVLNIMISIILITNLRSLHGQVEYNDGVDDNVDKRCSYLAFKNNKIMYRLYLKFLSTYDLRGKYFINRFIIYSRDSKCERVMLKHLKNINPS